MFKYLHNSKVFGTTRVVIILGVFATFKATHNLRKLLSDIFKVTKFFLTFRTSNLTYFTYDLQNRTVVCAVPECMYLYINFKNHNKRERYFFTERMKILKNKKINLKKEKKE